MLIRRVRDVDIVNTSIKERIINYECNLRKSESLERSRKFSS